MLLHKLHLCIRPFSTVTTSLNWRTQIKRNQLVSQISSILLQRQNWLPLLHTLNLSSKLTPPLFHQILLKTQTNPQISLSFFNWAKSNLRFQPLLKSHCKLIQISIQSGNFQPAKPILDSLIQTQLPPSKLVDSMIQACRSSDSQSLVLSFVLECYSHKGLFVEGLKVFRETRVHGYMFSIRACNALLDALRREDETKLAWCFQGAVIRKGVLPDRFTWSIIARILSQNGNLEKIVRMLVLGIYNSVIYNLVIDGYCKEGEFKAAFDMFNEMPKRKLNPGFSTCASILDGACKYGDTEVIEMIKGSMVENKLLPKSVLSEYDTIIQKFCDLGKMYAAEMFMKKAWDEEVGLEDATYGCMLRALSKEGRAKDAIQLYGVILERSITVNDSSYYAFVNVLCEEDPAEEVSELLREMIGRGFSPRAAELSKFITSQCDKRRWREAEDLLNVVLEKGLLPDSFCCCSLVEHYCCCGQIDSAMALHDKMEKLQGRLDVTTYNALLKGLFAKKRVEEAVNVFDYMRTQNLVSSASFSIMISGLCGGKELRKAMKIHDEMLKLGLKPEEAKYKRLISGFKY